MGMFILHQQGLTEDRDGGSSVCPVGSSLRRAGSVPAGGTCRFCVSPSVKHCVKYLQVRLLIWSSLLCIPLLPSASSLCHPKAFHSNSPIPPVLKDLQLQEGQANVFISHILYMKRGCCSFVISFPKAMGNPAPLASPHRIKMRKM